MNEWKGIKFIFSHKFSSAISQFLITMIATVVLDLMWAIIIGVLYSAILFMVSSSKLTVEHSEFTPSVGSHSNVVTVTGSLFFGAVHDFKHSFEGLRECEHLLISINGVTNIDVSGASAFAEVCQEFAERNVTVSVCGVRDNVMKILQRAGADSLINGHVYASADDAFEALMTTVS